MVALSMVQFAPVGTTTSPLTGPDSVPVHWVGGGGGGGPAMALVGTTKPVTVSTASVTVAHVFMPRFLPSFGYRFRHIPEDPARTAPDRTRNAEVRTASATSRSTTALPLRPRRPEEPVVARNARWVSGLLVGGRTAHRLRCHGPMSHCPDRVPATMLGGCNV